MTESEKAWTPKVHDYVETVDGVIGTIFRIWNKGYLTEKYGVVDCDGKQHVTNGVSRIIE